MLGTESNRRTLQLFRLRKEARGNDYASVKERYTLYFICFFLFVLIVSGNTLTFRLFDRVAVKVSDVLALILGLILLKSFFTERLAASVSIMLGWGVLSLFLIIFNTLFYSFGFGDVLTAFLYLFRFLYMLFLAYVTAAWFKERGYTLPVLQYINVLYVFVCILGLGQLLFYPVAYDFYKLFWSIGVYFPNADPHVGRIVSTYFDPNYFSSCVLIGVAVNYFLMERKEGKRHGLYWFFTVFYLFTILLTKSRSGLLGFFILTFVTVTLNFRKKKIASWKILLFVTAVLTVLFLFLFSDITTFKRIREVFEDESAQARFNSWTQALEIILKTRFLGIGYNLYGAYNEKIYGNIIEAAGYGTNSSLLLTVITTGAIGLILLLLHLYHLVSHGKSQNCMIGLILAALVICNFNNLLFYNLWVFPFYFVAYLMQTQKKERKKNDEVDS